MSARRWMPAVGRGIALLGFLFLLGAVGAADADLISVSELIWRGGAGLVLFCGGLTLVAATERG